MEASQWKPGMYDLRIAFGKPGARPLGEQSTWFQVAKPSLFEVSFGFNGAAYVNGRAFFPRGLYDISREQLELINELSRKAGLPTFTLREMLAKVKAQGFNVGLMGDGFPSQDMLEAADELGFYLLPCDTLVKKEEIDLRVSEANKHPCILAWYGVDEMSDAYNYVNLSMDA